MSKAQSGITENEYTSVGCGGNKRQYLKHKTMLDIISRHNGI